MSASWTKTAISIQQMFWWRLMSVMFTVLAFSGDVIVNFIISFYFLGYVCTMSAMSAINRQIRK